VLKAGLRLTEHAKFKKLASDINIRKTGTGRHCSKSRKTENGRQAGGGLFLASTESGSNTADPLN
jgi:hypothetical protein